MKSYLLNILFLIFCCSCGRAQELKPLLLKNVGILPMPGKDEAPVSLFVTINERPEIIAISKLELGLTMQANTMMVSGIDKGLIWMLGSTAYLDNSLLANQNV